jgi:hypothetical protein
LEPSRWLSTSGIDVHVHGRRRIDHDIDFAELRCGLLERGCYFVFFDDVGCGDQVWDFQVLGSGFEARCLASDKRDTCGACD